MAPLLLILLLLVGLPAPAVLIDSGDGTGNTSAPSPDPGWDHVGVTFGLTAVYIGDGCVIAPNHVGAGDVDFGGVVYPDVPGSEVQISNGDGTFADLVVFAVNPAPPLPILPISVDPPPLNEPIIVAGNGRDRGAATSWDPSPGGRPSALDGYEWAPGRTLRWGTNRVEEFPAGKILQTWSFTSFFDLSGAAATTHEAQLTPGDSGGAAFWQNGSDWELAGLLFAIATYPGQPADTSFEGQPSYMVDLSFYRDEILAECLPEPSGGLAAGALALVALARRRRRA